MGGGISFFQKLTDAALEASVAGSFTGLGVRVRRRVSGWESPKLERLRGKTVVITGATSGLGLAAAKGVLRGGANLCFVARNPVKAERVQRELEPLAPGRVFWVAAEMGDLESVRAASESILAQHPRVHALVHNAGALDDAYASSPQGYEQTVASHLLGPALLSERLRPGLESASPASIIWVSSGGMYAEPLDVDGLEMMPADYDGVRAYAKAKRAQVTYAELRSAQWGEAGVAVHSLHPGWVDTPGVARSLPGFHRWVGPWLRTPEEGVDTLLWLLTADPAELGTGAFWHDRARREIHRLGRTRRADTQAERERLEEWVKARTSQFLEDG